MVTYVVEVTMFNSKAKAVWRLQWHQMSSKLDVIGNMHKHIRVIEASDIKSEGYTLAGVRISFGGQIGFSAHVHF